MSTDLLLLAAKGRHGEPNLTRRQRRGLARSLRARRFAAGLVVDLGNTTDYRVSVAVGSGGGGTVIGQVVDLLHAHVNTNLFVAGGAASGEAILDIQTAPATTSGSFTDPTSGLPAGAFPVGGFILSGGRFYANSGLWASGNSSPQAAVNNAPLFCSGGVMFGHFQRPHRYARINSISGAFAAAITAGFIGQKHHTGSGGGFTLAPGSGAVSV